FGNAPLDELLDIGGIASKHARETGVILPAFGDQAGELGARAGEAFHADSYRIRKVPRQVGIQMRTQQEHTSRSSCHASSENRAPPSGEAHVPHPFRAR